MLWVTYFKSKFIEKGKNGLTLKRVDAIFTL